jgi:hypothetical protein
LIDFSVGKTVIFWRASGLGEGTSLWIYQPAHINPQSVVQYGVYTINLGAKEMVVTSRWRHGTVSTCGARDETLLLSISLFLSPLETETRRNCEYRREKKKGSQHTMIMINASVSD